MALNFTVTTTVTRTAQNDDSKRLFHGTVKSFADCIMEVGINADQARQGSQGASDGAFWLTDDYWEAIRYARMPTYHDGQPTVIAVDFPNQSLEECLRQENEGVEVHLYKEFKYYEFLPPSHDIVNSSITNITVTVIEQ